MNKNNRDNLEPGAHKFTDADREKARQSKMVNTSMRKTAKKLRGTAWTEDADAVKLFDAFAIPEQERTVGTLIVIRAALGAMAGNQGDRHDYIRLTGDDPDVAVREEELKLKKEQQTNQTDVSEQELAIRARVELMAKVEAAMRGENDD